MNKKLIVSALLGITIFSTQAFAGNLFALGFRIYQEKVWLKTHHRLYPIMEKIMDGDYDNINVADGSDLVHLLSTQEGRNKFYNILINNGYDEDEKYIKKLLESKNPRIVKAVLVFFKRIADGYIPPSCM